MREVMPAQILARRYLGCLYVLHGEELETLEWLDDSRPVPSPVEFWAHEQSVAKELRKEEKDGDPDQSSRSHVPGKRPKK